MSTSKERCRVEALSGGAEPLGLDFDRDVRRQWREILHECLYEGTPPDLETETHPYLQDFLTVVRDSALTINLNFDDTIERMLSATRSGQERTQTRGYETTWRGLLQASAEKGVIYHPNGFIPSNLLEGPSDDFVFSEGEFADQLFDVVTGHYTVLLSHLTRNTCLFLGVSLGDPTLRYLLRQSTRLSPGNIHYFVSYVEDRSLFNKEEARAISAANFEVFNLVTLFLTSEEIAGLGVLLTMEANEVRTLAENYWGKPPVFCYYVTGSIGAGKTTAVSYLQNLQAYREWVDPPPPLLSKRFTDLTSDQKREVDEWIRGQFAQRNVNLNREHEGIFFIDRSPLDPLAFQQEEERQAAARRMRDAISPGNSGRTICPGHVIMLRGDPRELSARVRERHKTAEPDYVERLQEATKAIYPQRGVTYLDIRDLGLAEVVRRISRIIHFEEYVECDLHARLVELAEELSQ